MSKNYAGENPEESREQRQEIFDTGSITCMHGEHIIH